MSFAPARVVHCLACIATALGVEFAANQAWSAESAAPAAANAAPATDTPAPRSLRVWVDVGDSGLDKVAIQSAIARELGANVELADSSDTALRIACTDDQRVRVLYRTEAGEELSRVVDLPESSERKVEVIALMVGNLTRNEAAELLAALQPQPAEAPKPEAPPPTPRKAPPAPAAKPQPKPVGGYLHAKRPGINASFYYPLATLPDSDRRVFAIEVAAAYGRVGAIQGIGVALGALHVENQVDGLALGLGATRVDGPLRGVQLGVLYSESHGEQLGLNLSALLLYQRGKTTGFAVSGLAAFSEDVDGVAVAGALDVAHHVRGAHIAGLAAIASDRVDGVQIGGAIQSTPEMNGFSAAALLNRAGRTRGVAAAGLATVTGDLDGVAIGIVNVGGSVHGAQVGVVNVATKDVQGYQLGIVNYAHENGDTQALAFCDSLVPFNIGIKFTTGYGYSELGLSSDATKSGYQAFLGLGAHLPLARFSFDVGGRISSSNQDDPNNGGPKRTDVHYLARMNLRLTRAVELFAGGGARHGVIGEGAGTAQPEVLGGVALF